jgi:hypothetical protein
MKTMTNMETRAIPDFAVGALESMRFEDFERGQNWEFYSPVICEDDTSEMAAKKRNEVSETPRPQNTSLWTRTFNASAATALLWWTQSFAYGGGCVTPDYLAVLEDNGLTRAMINIDDVKRNKAVTMSRAQLSMQETELTQSESAMIHRDLETASVRPKTKISILPAYEG